MQRPVGRERLLILLLCLGVFYGQSARSYESAFAVLSPNMVQIYTDCAGVPHVVAETTAGAYWGFGYSLAKDRMFQLEILRRSVNGTLSELFGINFVEADYIARRDGISKTELYAGFKDVSPDFREALGAFTNGINAAIKACNEKKILEDAAFSAVGVKPTFFTESDLLNIFAGTMAVRYNDFTQELDNLHLLSSLVRRFGSKTASNIFEDVVFFEDPSVYSTLDEFPGFKPQLRHMPSLPSNLPSTESLNSPTLRSRKKNEHLKTLGIPDKSGSYAVVLSNRSRGKKEALLLGGPQMGYFKPSALYEVGLHTPKFDLVGTTPVGYFPLIFGTNRNIGFTATAGVANLVDIVSLSSDSKEPDTLVGRDIKIRKTVRRESIKVKGQKQPIIKIVETTSLGPIIAVEGRINYIKHRGWSNHITSSYAAWFDSNHSDTLNAWLNVSDGMALSINWLGADRVGHIAYSYCGVGKSRRSFGDDRLPCNRPAEFPYPDLRISAMNPPSGFFTNWNCPPISSFRDGDMQTGWGHDQRTAFLAKHITENRDCWSIDFLNDLDRKIAFTDQRAFFYLTPLLEFIKQESLSPLGASAFHLLARWDGTRTDVNRDGLFDSPAPGLFDAFWIRLFNALFAKYLGDFIWMIASDPTWTQSSIVTKALKGNSRYDYLEGRIAADFVTEIFQAAVDSLASEGKPLPLLPCPAMEFPGSNYVGASTRVVPATFTPFMNRGSDIQIMSLSPDAVKIWGILPPGNTAQGPHQSDQINDFRDFRYRERFLTLSEVKRNARGISLIKIVDPQN